VRDDSEATNDLDRIIVAGGGRHENLLSWFLQALLYKL
jgi:hypothetical protein